MWFTLLKVFTTNVHDIKLIKLNASAGCLDVFLINKKVFYFHNAQIFGDCIINN